MSKGSSYLSGGEHGGVDEAGLEGYQGHRVKPEGLLVKLVLWMGDVKS